MRSRDESAELTETATLVQPWRRPSGNACSGMRLGMIASNQPQAHVVTGYAASRGTVGGLLSAATYAATTARPSE
jgi:hypothetical protein